jgi:aminoglycoside phosphotransferase (APT) family kinase protein
VHAQTEVTVAQVRALLAAQMPDLAVLPVKRVALTGPDTMLFRIGLTLVGRFPRLPPAEAQISTLAQWMPGLAGALPLAVPVTKRLGLPGAGYPLRWTVLSWLPGHAAFAGPLDQDAAARTLAGFLRALQAQPAPPGAPLRGDADRLDLRLDALAPFIGQLQGQADPLALAKVAARLRKLPPPVGAPVWVHGDLHPMNLLAQRHKLTGVIDWGGLGLGDPAVDLMIGWTLFDAPARAVLHAALAPAPEVWARARALAFARAVPAIPTFRRANPGFASVMRRTLTRVLDELA